MEDEDFTKLPIEEACTHKVWKARLIGYEAAAKHFQQIEDDKSNEWNKFMGLVKKFVVDSHALCQEKGLEAVLIFVENCGNAGRTTGDVVSGIIQKCLAAPKAKTKDLGAQIILMYIEIEKFEIVCEELLKGTESKNPKVSAASLHVLTQALREFGPKVINVNKIIKRLPSLLEDRDVNVRSETRSLLCEIYHWLGAAIRPQFTTLLKPNILAEIDAEHEKVKGTPLRPGRLLRSQQAKKAALGGPDNTDGATEDANGDCTGIEEADPYDLLEPVDVLSQLSKDFYTKLESKKWSERKTALEELERLLSAAPKLESADYGDMLRALKKVISKDSNVVVVTFAIKCLTGIANGLKKKFSQYSASLMSVLFEKFKEKKLSVVTALRDAVDAVYMTTTLEALQEDIVTNLENKNPNIKSEIAAFLSRCFTKCTPAILTKKLLKPLCKALTTALRDQDPSVRDNSALALGTAMKVVGEKNIGPFFLEIDAQMLKKIKECCDKAEIVAKPAPVKKVDSKSQNDIKQDKNEKSAVKPKAKISKPVSGVSAGNVENQTSVKGLTRQEALNKAKVIFPNNVVMSASNGDLEKHIQAINKIRELLPSVEVNEETAQATLALLYSSDKQISDELITTRLEVIKMVADSFPLPGNEIEYVIVDVVSNLNVPAFSSLASETLTSFANNISLNCVARVLFNESHSETDSSLWTEKLNWISSCIMKSTIVGDPDFIVDCGRKASVHPDATVRNAGLALIGTLHLANVGTNKSVAEKPSVGSENAKRINKANQQITKEKDIPKDVILDEVSEKNKICDSLSKVDLGAQITDQLMAELSDKNWKVRAEAVGKLQLMVNNAKNITSNLGEAAPVIAARISDSNTKISASAIALLESLVTAMGPPSKTFVRAFLPVLIKALGDTKAWIRSAAIPCLNTWGEICGYKEFFDGEIIADALKTGSPTLRSELWNWLSDKLPNIPPKTIPKDELIACLPTLFANLEDRNADVRKNACESVLGFMIHLGFNNMISACDNIKGSGGGQVKQILEKTRGSLPVQPIQKSKPLAAEKSSRPSTAKPPASSSATITKSRSKGNIPSSKSNASLRKKEEEAESSPLLQVNNLKHQRVIDEQKLKTLKWNFVTPRAEFVELLREQMMNANMNKTLIGNMFHNDFRYHLRAIDALTEDLTLNRDALMCNLDLILRWMTLRFFDTNPSVLLKGLEYLNSVFNILIEEDYSMLDSEAAAFFPYLILKVGDSKDTVRNSVRALFKQIGAVYPLSKQFSFVMEGLKSKNARQRSECLEQLGWLIENYGVSVCHPTPGSALKEIAKHIADRDTAVRNAALNCVVTAYFLDGDKVLKMVGQISEKDMTLLEERIKRAAKNRPVASVKPLQTIAVTSSPEELSSPPLEESFEEPEVQEAPVSVVTAAVMSPPRTRPTSGTYVIDNEIVEKIEYNTVQFEAPKLVNIDLQFLVDSSHQSAVKPFQMPKVTPTLSNFSQPPVIKWELAQIPSSDIDKAMASMAKIDTILSSDKRHHLTDFVDYMVTQLIHLLIILNQSAHPEVVNCYRSNFSLLMKLCDHEDLCRLISEGTLAKLLEQFLLLLTEPRLETLTKHDNFHRVVNNLIIRLLDHSNKTNIMCALLKTLYGTVNNPKATVSFQDLVVKCIWKLNKTHADWDSELDYSKILLEFHRFLKDYPTVWWKNKEVDLPLRTIKTVLHTMVKMRGTKVREIVEQIPDISKDSELYTYIKKVIKHLKVEDHGNDNHCYKENEPRNIIQNLPRLSKENQDELSEIFRMIGDVEGTSQGLKRLFLFRKTHPEADVEAFLSKTTPTFQQYIRRGLHSLEQQESYQKLDSNKSETIIKSGGEKEPSKKEAEIFWNRLQNLQGKHGCQVEKKKEENSEITLDKASALVGIEDNTSEMESMRKRFETIKSNIASS